jgi:hypothetical protein
MSEVQVTEKDREFLEYVRMLFEHEMNWAVVKSIEYDKDFNVHVVLTFEKQLFTDYDAKKIMKIAEFLECEDYAFCVELEDNKFRVGIMLKWEGDEDES